MKIVVAVKLKDDVPDSDGRVILDRVHAMGLNEVRGVRAGKLYEIEIEGGEAMAGERIVKEFCQDLLANVTIEDFEILSVAS